MTESDSSPIDGERFQMNFDSIVPVTRAANAANPCEAPVFAGMWPRTEAVSKVVSLPRRAEPCFLRVERVWHSV